MPRPMGFQNTDIFLAASVLIITLISVFTLTNDKKLKEDAKTHPVL